MYEMYESMSMRYIGDVCMIYREKRRCNRCMWYLFENINLSKVISEESHCKDPVSDHQSPCTSLNTALGVDAILKSIRRPGGRLVIGNIEWDVARADTCTFIICNSRNTRWITSCIGRLSRRCVTAFSNLVPCKDDHIPGDVRIDWMSCCILTCRDA